MGSVPILCVNVHITTDKILKNDANAGADVDFAKVWMDLNSYTAKNMELDFQKKPSYS